MILGEAGKADLVIYVGARLSQRLEFVNSASGTPIDLSGMGPWKCEVANAAGEELLSITVDDTNSATGILVLTAAPALTEALEPDTTHRWGLQNNIEEYIMDGKAIIRSKYAN